MRRAFRGTLDGVPALRLTCAVCAFILGAMHPAVAQQASTERRDGMLDRMAASSTLVIRGRVDATESRAHDGTIYTYATVAVTEVLKGPDSIETLVVKTLGGATDALVLHVPDAPRFGPGDEAVMFLAPRPRDGTLYPVALAQGIWPVSVDLAGRGSQAGRGDWLGPFDASFRERVARSAPATAPYVLTPPEWPPASQATYALLTTTTGGPARWHQADDGYPVVVNFQTGASTSALDGAMALWNASGSVLTLVRGGDGPSPLDRRCAAFSGSGTVELTWSGPCDEIAATDTTTVGIGGGYFTPGRLKTIGTTTFEGFVQGVAILNPNRPNASSGGCTLDAVAHLLGHAIGLGHSDVPGAVMAATPRASCTSGTPSLDADDIAGIRAVYADIASGPAPPHAPTAITSSAVLNAVTLQWTPAATGGAVQTYKLEAASSPGGPNFLNPPFTTTSSSLQVSGVPEGRYFVRVRASNPWGDSGVSPETQVVVGPCTVPSAPSGLTGTVNGRTVSFTWTAPTQGLIQSYQLSAGFSSGQSDVAILPGLTSTSFSTDAPDGTYFVRVAAVNVCGIGPATPDTRVQVRSCSAAPDPPTNVRATSGGGLVTLTWEAPVAGDRPSRYRIRAGLSPNDLSLLGSGVLTGDSRPTLTASAGPGTYYVQVISTNLCGDSTPAATVAITVTP